MQTIVGCMQAVGMANDHQTTCFRHAQVRAMAGHG